MGEGPRLARRPGPPLRPRGVLAQPGPALGLAGPPVYSGLRTLHLFRETVVSPTTNPRNGAGRGRAGCGAVGVGGAHPRWVGRSSMRKLRGPAAPRHSPPHPTIPEQASPGGKWLSRPSPCACVAGADCDATEAGAPLHPIPPGYARLRRANPSQVNCGVRRLGEALPLPSHSNPACLVYAPRLSAMPTPAESMECSGQGPPRLPTHL